MQTASGQFVGLLNFKSILHNKAFLLAFTNTGRFVGVCIPVLLVLSLGIAVSLAKQTAYAEILKTGRLFYSMAANAFLYHCVTEWLPFLSGNYILLLHHNIPLSLQ